MTLPQYLTCLLLLACAVNLAAAPQHVEIVSTAHLVECYDFLEVEIRVVKPDAPNPFKDVVVEGSFRRGEETPIRVDGFCDAEDGRIYRIRFLPARPGDYVYQVRFVQGDYRIEHTGRFQARSSGRRGLLRVDPSHPEHFLWEGTGEHYFWNGTTTYYLMGWRNDTMIQSIIDRLAAQKINRLRVLVYGRNQDQPWGQPVRSTDNFKLYLNPWLAAEPDHVENPGFDLNRFNVDYWQRYERMLRYARERDMIISVIFFIGGQVLPTPFAACSEDEIRFYRYGVARLAAFSNVTWDLGNEHNFHREVPRWCDWLGPRVKEWDPYDHLLSAHNVIYRTPGATWNDLQLIQNWDAGQNTYLLNQRKQQSASGRTIPQVNEEYGYEDLWEKSPGQRSADTRRRVAWEIAMAGCYQTTGETANRGVGFPPDTGGGWVSGRGDDQMTMLDGYRHMVNFFTALPWWRLAPANDLVKGAGLCLQEVGMRYVLYCPGALAPELQLPDGVYRVRRFHPKSGAWADQPVASGPIWTGLKPPTRDDWVWLIERADGLIDRDPPVPLQAALMAANRIRIAFSEKVRPETAANPHHFEMVPPAQIRRVTVEEGPGHAVLLEVDPLVPGGRYEISVRDIEDASSMQNRMKSPVSLHFTAHDPSRPIVELQFDTVIQNETPNTGTSADLVASGRPTHPLPVLARNGGLDFKDQPGEYALDVGSEPMDPLRGLVSLTICGWLNCRSADMGPGGNRIVTTMNNGNDGFDLVFLDNGSLQFSVNQWPDGLPTSSSAGKIPVDPQAQPANWRFFAVTYDSTRSSGQLQFFFGSARQPAQLDRSLDYARGPVGAMPGPLAIGHFNPLTRPGHADRMFRGLIDDIRIFGSRIDASGALPLEQLRQLQATAFSQHAETPIIKIERQGDRWQLMRNGQPFFIKGAVGWSRLDQLAAAGANAVRMGANEKALDQAQRLGLSVLAGLPLGIPRRGFDYGDPAKVNAQRERIRQIVITLKNHPALLLWAIGNEPTIFTPREQRVLLWREVNHVAELIKSIDPHHPVISVVGGEQWRNQMGELDEFCPALDAVGLNAYADMLSLPEDLARQNWNRPYLITEFGPRGHWQVPKTSWGARWEDSSTEKAAFYRRAYEHAVKDRPHCLGAFAFLWGWKMEKTHTWYGMFLEDGSRTEAVDGMGYYWSGQWPANRCPSIGPSKIRIQPAGGGAVSGTALSGEGRGAPGADKEANQGAGEQASAHSLASSHMFVPGEKLSCTVAAIDPDDDLLAIEWDLRRDVADDPRVGGDFEPLEPALKGAVLESKDSYALIQLPEQPGKYRVFVYVRDGHGGAATANVPLITMSKSP